MARDVQATQDTAATETVFITGSGRGNIFSNWFDTAACFTSSSIGGADCLAEPPTQQEQQNAGYNYNYSSNSDGSYKIIITPDDENKNECTDDNVELGDNRIETAVDAAAVRCLG